MKFTILMGSPRPQGNTAALLAPFLEECRFLGIQTQCIHLYDKKVGPCLGCMACQDVPTVWAVFRRTILPRYFRRWRTAT